MKYVIIWLIKGYKRLISPLKREATCRFYPCCSTYAITALQRFGAVRGGLLAFWRICRCNPFNIGGIDPVPDKFTFKSQVRK